MKSRQAFRLVAAAAAATIGVLGSVLTANSADFEAVEVDQDAFLSVAIPAGSLVPYKLWLIRETQPGANCWAVNGDNPGVVDPIWTANSTTCGTTSATNGYSIRVGGEELRSEYALTVEESNGELVLIGKPLRGKSFLIGRTGGITADGYLEIDLEPGWRITQRTFEGDRLSHFYYTNDATLASLLEGEDIATGPSPTPTPTPEVDYPFPDISRDPYAQEIAAAFSLGIVSGQQNGTFAPTRPVTREEAVSIVVEALENKGFVVKPEVLVAPFPDVSVDRWSAPKIQALKEAGIVTGDQNGLFRPASTITRAELMSLVRRAAEVKVSVGADGVRPEQLTPTGEVFNFSDTDGHWNESTIDTMSAYCGVATPYNERGTEFRPNADSLRNYTTAAVFRAIDCGATPLN
ncbi:MAG: DUF3747 domain-containing protein [Leptolyngbyaceae cyanobacterium]